MGTTSIGLTYPATRGEGVTWADGYEANLTLLTNYLRGYLKRVDTGAWEAMQTGVEYYAPPPYNVYTGARAQLFEATGAGASITLIASGISKLVASFGYHLNGATGNYQTHGQHLDTNFNSALTVESNALVLQRGTSLDDASDGYSVFAIYVKS